MKFVLSRVASGLRLGCNIALQIRRREVEMIGEKKKSFFPILNLT